MFDFSLTTRFIIATIAFLVCIALYAIIWIFKSETIIGFVIGCYGYQLIDYAIYKFRTR